MLTAPEVQAFLRQFEPLREVVVHPVSELIEAPWLVKLYGDILIYGEPHRFETELDLKQFGGSSDLLKLAEKLLTSFAGAAQYVKAS